MFIKEILGIELRFKTNSKVFSPTAIDKGTQAMLKKIEITTNDKVLDLGCGYGAVGLYAAHFAEPTNIVMCDISAEAVKLAQENAQINSSKGVKIITSDAFDNIQDRDFTLVLSNPPYHTDFSVAKRFIEGAYRHFAIDGRLCMVTKRRLWYENKIKSVFGGVKVIESDGYFVFIGEKRNAIKKVSPQKKKRLSKKLQKRKG